jgi:excisionase family DNA binding protein
MADFDYYTVAEVAKAFRVSVMTIHRMVNDGKLAAVRVGRSVRIPVAEVKRLRGER